MSYLVYLFHCIDSMDHLTPIAVTESITHVQLEKYFRKNYGSLVPEGYVQQFTSMLDNLALWITRAKLINGEQTEFVCPIMKGILRIEGHTLNLMLIEIRPCAEGRGFYKRILEALRKACVNNGIMYLRVPAAFERNSQILRHLGFTNYHGNHWHMNIETLRQENWDTGKPYPSAAELNAGIHMQPLD